MKRGLIAGLLFCSACSVSNSADPVTGAAALEPGQYLYEDKTITAAVRIGGGVGVTIFVDGAYVYQDLNGIVKDTGYSFGALVLNRTSTDSKTFTAYVEHNSTGIDLPSYMDFRLDNRTLDANGDGLVDGR